MAKYTVEYGIAFEVDDVQTEQEAIDKSQKRIEAWLASENVEFAPEWFALLDNGVKREGN
ncbi:MAG TPA: hypothetical protein VJN02_03250 [Gammaproteobacteria bacterium]|nr:hypothetical protein [Gammaproteobacteria bacterium]